MIPFSLPDIGQEEILAVKKVLESGWLAHGPKTEEFETEFARYVATRRAISLNSCTAALHLAFQSVGIGKGDEVIMPAFTMVASANAILHAGAKPVLVDIDYATGNLDPEKVREAIGEKTKAIMPVHFGGLSCRMDEIMDIAQKYNLTVVEDSAEAIGAEFKGRKTGTFGIGCFSFYPTKNMTTGEGGMVTTNSNRIADAILTMRGHGISKGARQREKEEKPWLRIQTMLGYNYRLTDFQAAMGLVQLRKLDKMNNLRRKHAQYLNQELESLEEVEIPVEPKGYEHVYQMYTIKVQGINRDEFVIGLRKKGVCASVHFDPPVHLSPFYKERFSYREGEFPMTEKLAKSIVSLPMYPQLLRKELDTIVSTVKEVIKDVK